MNAPPIIHPDTHNFTIDFMLFILAIVQRYRFTDKLAMDLARAQYFHFMQPPPSTTPFVEDMAD
jgi:hypothetical protein